jgi:hypothetical protein
MKVAAHTTTKVHHFFSMPTACQPGPLSHHQFHDIRLFAPPTMVSYVTSMTIDALDRRIIQALYIDPRAPFSRLSEVLGSLRADHRPPLPAAVRRSSVRVVGQLDSQRLGRSDWAVRIRCAPGSAPTVATKTGGASGHGLGAADLGGNRDLQHDPLSRPRTANPACCSASSRSAVRLSPSRPTASSTCSPPERPLHPVRTTSAKGDRPAPSRRTGQDLNRTIDGHAAGRRLATRPGPRRGRPRSLPAAGDAHPLARVDRPAAGRGTHCLGRPLLRR